MELDPEKLANFTTLEDSGLLDDSSFLKELRYFDEKSPGVVDAKYHGALANKAADRIEAIEVDKERMREAAQRVADAWGSGRRWDYSIDEVDHAVERLRVVLTSVTTTTDEATGRE